ncbi:MAG: hypothetical protein GXP08_07755 [Gammaproteobacteria bacterium]|nr:hypothetical protein [Gammaproteobacteria bacterium]
MLPLTLSTANGKITFLTANYHRMDGEYLAFSSSDQAERLIEQFQDNAIAVWHLDQLYCDIHHCVSGTLVSWAQIQQGLAKKVISGELHAVKHTDESSTAAPSGRQKPREEELPGLAGYVQAMNERNRRYQETWANKPLEPLPRPQPTLRYRYFLKLQYQFDDGDALAGMPYRATLSDNSVRTGKLDDTGQDKLSDIPQGITTVEFGWPSLTQQLDQARQELAAYLDDIIAEVQEKAAQQQQALADAGVLEQGQVYTLAFLGGLYDSVTDLADTAVDILGEIDEVRQEAYNLLLRGNPAQMKTAFEDLARYGEDTLQDLQQAQHSLALLFEDAAIKTLLVRFPSRYWEALSGVGKAQMVGGLSFSLLITLVTAGAGAAAAVVSKVPSIMKAANKIQDILQLMEKTRLNKTARKDQDSLIRMSAVRPKKQSLDKKPPKKCNTCKKDFNPQCPLADAKRRGKGENDRIKETLHNGIRDTTGNAYPKQHPWYQGEKSLEVHHCIDVNSVKNAVWVEIVNAFRYDINEPHNSVVLPAAMDTACHLKVARHKSSHAQGHAFDAPKPGTGASLSNLQALEKEKDYAQIPDYEQKFLTYPDAVKEEIRKIRLMVKRGALCGHKTARQQKAAFERKMRKISEKILRRIDDFTWTLSRDGRDYRPDSACGCANQLELGKKRRGEECNTNRQHGYDMTKTSKLTLGH